jgi:transcriptional regulator with XRE-family HTH domain
MSIKLRKSEINKAIGNKLLRIRQKTGLSQQNVAFDLEFSPTSYSKLESGKVDISVSRLIQLAEYFEVYAPDFLDNEMDMPRTLSEVKPISEYKQMETKLEILQEMFGGGSKK